MTPPAAVVLLRWATHARAGKSKLSDKVLRTGNKACEEVEGVLRVSGVSGVKRDTTYAILTHLAPSLPPTAMRVTGDSRRGAGV